MSKRIFISYATEDFEAANKLYDRLAADGFSPWMDRRDLIAGQKWRIEIPEVIRRSAYVIVLLSSRSLTKRGYVQKELKLALDAYDEFPTGEIFLIPVKLEDCDPKDPRLADLHWVELFDDRNDGYSRILRALGRCDAKKRLSEDPAFQNDVRRYCKTAVNLHRDLPVAGFPKTLRAPIQVEDIYVTLRAMVDLRAFGDSCYADSEDAEKCLGEARECREIDLPEAIEEAKRRKRQGLVILGDPGSGKTTHLKRVLLWCLSDKPKPQGLSKDMLPVFLPLRDLTDLSQGLAGFIESQLDHPHLSTPQGFGEKMLERGRLLLLFDGLDEVADADQRAKVSRWIQDALDVYPDCFFAVTCRFAGYTDDARFKSRFLELHVRPLSPEKADEFVRNWYRIVEHGLCPDPDQADALAKTKADDLLQRLAQPEYRARKVLTMTRNPLLLTNLCLVHRDRGQLPQRRAVLYKECVEVLLELWRRAKKIPSRVTALDGQRVLQPAALYMHVKNLKRAKGEDLEKYIRPALKSVQWPHGAPADFLAAVREDSGLLTGWGSGEYGFMHLGFQEYLAAREIWRRYFQENKKNDLKVLAKGFGSAWWREVILLLLAVPEISIFEPFFNEVVRSDAFAQDDEMVDMCLEDAAEVSSRPFLELLKKNPEAGKELWERQKAALRVLTRIDKNAVKGLKDALSNHPDDTIRALFARPTDRVAKETVVSEKGGIELVKIPGGVFMMGSPETEEGRYDDEGPLHEVSVETLFMGKFPVTNEQYGRYLSENPDAREPDYWSDGQYNLPEQPVVGIDWQDANKFARWAGLCLPSEAQWEYACRAGTRTKYYSGDDEKALERVGWYGGNSERRLHPVGEKEPNDFGLYDMHGNVWEWCEDDWHEDYKGAPKDGNAWVDDPRGSGRVVRGGSWFVRADFCRAAIRYDIDPSRLDDDLGFRLVFLPGRQAS